MSVPASQFDTSELSPVGTPNPLKEIEEQKKQAKFQAILTEVNSEFSEFSINSGSDTHGPAI